MSQLSNEVEQYFADLNFQRHAEAKFVLDAYPLVNVIISLQTLVFRAADLLIVSVPPSALQQLVSQLRAACAPPVPPQIIPVQRPVLCVGRVRVPLLGVTGPPEKSAAPTQPPQLSPPSPPGAGGGGWRPPRQATDSGKENAKDAKMGKLSIPALQRLGFPAATAAGSGETIPSSKPSEGESENCLVVGALEGLITHRRSLPRPIYAPRNPSPPPMVGSPRPSPTIDQPPPPPPSPPEKRGPSHAHQQQPLATVTLTQQPQQTLTGSQQAQALAQARAQQASQKQQQQQATIMRRVLSANSKGLEAALLGSPHTDDDAPMGFVSHPRASLPRLPPLPSLPTGALGVGLYGRGPAPTSSAFSGAGNSSALFSATGGTLTPTTPLTAGSSFPSTPPTPVTALWAPPSPTAAGTPSAANRSGAGSLWSANATGVRTLGHLGGSTTSLALAEGLPAGPAGVSTRALLSGSSSVQSSVSGAPPAATSLNLAATLAAAHLGVEDTSPPLPASLASPPHFSSGGAGVWVQPQLSASTTPLGDAAPPNQPPAVRPLLLSRGSGAAPMSAGPTAGAETPAEGDGPAARAVPPPLPIPTARPDDPPSAPASAPGGPVLPSLVAVPRAPTARQRSRSRSRSPSPHAHRRAAVAPLPPLPPSHGAPVVCCTAAGMIRRRAVRLFEPLSPLVVLPKPSPMGALHAASDLGSRLPERVLDSRLLRLTLPPEADPESSFLWGLVETMERLAHRIYGHHRAIRGTCPPWTEAARLLSEELFGSEQGCLGPEALPTGWVPEAPALIRREGDLVPLFLERFLGRLRAWLV
ncbi:hypothetical protein PAPYR_3700 [Paratrimastix pyriformis]|uniref:Uncharacterized protein n=1 Tax=Paratrimastix pyriformis TaxID=342808 RepID=A0ABQ8UPT2_9EUKA|nr:hypothetical protein PAPYR_3700 [Paratrimastix pyriformis]